jgi:hypothetical protein
MEWREALRYERQSTLYQADSQPVTSISKSALSPAKTTPSSSSQSISRKSSSNVLDSWVVVEEDVRSVLCSVVVTPSHLLFFIEDHSAPDFV